MSSDDITRVAHAMVNAMRGQPSYVADEGLGCVLLEGIFDMRAVALAAMAAMEVPTEAPEQPVHAAL